MTKSNFPTDFMWGTASAAYQVEGGNTHSDWHDWELNPKGKPPLADPVGQACDHYHRYPDDIAHMARLGFNSYRFSVEWSRVEPEEGQFDEMQIAHYKHMVDVCHAHQIKPVITLQHFTLPLWFAAKGGWLAQDAPKLFARYADRVASRFKGLVEYYTTINEPGNLLTRGYLASFPCPPFKQDIRAFEQAVDGLSACHIAAREAIKAADPSAKVGIAHAIQDWADTPSASVAVDFSRRVHEDVFFAASEQDDFIGLQTYTRIEIEMSAIEAWLLALLLKSTWATNRMLLPIMRANAAKAVSGQPATRAASDRKCQKRYTEMGYPWAPEAIEATLARVHSRFPGKEIFITEHGIATNDDEERIEYTHKALTSIHTAMQQGLPIIGYLHWSFLDNWEWWDGYEPKFGLIQVDRQTMARSEKPSARWLGELAQSGVLHTP